MSLKAEIERAEEELDELDEAVEDQGESLEAMVELLASSRIETRIEVETRPNFAAFAAEKRGQVHDELQDIQIATDKLLEETLEELEVQRELNAEVRLAEGEALAKIEQLETDWSRALDEAVGLKSQLEEANATIVQSSSLYAERSEQQRSDHEGNRDELDALREQVKQQQAASPSKEEEALKHQLGQLVDEARTSKLHDMQSLHAYAERVHELEGELTCSKMEVASTIDQLSAVRIECRTVLTEERRREDTNGGLTETRERLAEAEEARGELQREVETLKLELHMTQAQLDDSKAESPPRSPSDEPGPFQRLFCCFKSNQAGPYPDHPTIDHQRLVDEEPEEFDEGFGHAGGRE